jgi:hypothetical protein
VTRKMLTGSPSLSSATCAVPRQSSPGRALATSRRADHPGLGDEGCLRVVMLLEMLQLGTRTMEVRLKEGAVRGSGKASWACHGGPSRRSDGGLGLSKPKSTELGSGVLLTNTTSHHQKQFWGFESSLSIPPRFVPLARCVVLLGHLLLAGVVHGKVIIVRSWWWSSLGRHRS